VPKANPERAPERTVYRVRFTMTLIVIVWGLMMLILVIAAFEPKDRLETWQSIVDVIGGAILSSPGLKAVLSSVRVTATGLTVVNTFHTYRLTWQEIDRIELGRYKVSFVFCLIYATDGRVIPAIGLASNPARPKSRASVEAREATAALQARLAAARAGIGAA
jgi:hypothetical protein